MPGWRRNLQLCFARYEIDGRGEGAVRALICDLRRQKDRYAERDTQDVERAEQRMPPQITQNMPPKNAIILFLHLADLRDSILKNLMDGGELECESIDPQIFGRTRVGLIEDTSLASLIRQAR